MAVKTRVSNATFIVLFIYTMVAMILIPYVGQYLAFSKFYSSERLVDVSKNIVENRIRVEEAKAALKEFNLQYSRYLFSDRTVLQPEFSFVVISVSRPGNVQYLTQVVAALVWQIVNTDSIFMVYNAEGLTHREAIELSRIVPVESLEASSIKKEPSTKIDLSAEPISKYVKEKEDYIKVLMWCLERNTQFCVIFQDDALPPKYFMERLKFIIKYRMSAGSKTWGFLKLYYPEKWEGWSSEWSIIIELILTSGFGGAVLTAVTSIIQYVITKSPLKTHNICIRSIFSFLLVIYALLTLGRPHWLALRSVSPHLSSVIPAPGCCIPAVVYPQEHLSNIISYLQKSKSSRDYPLDLVLDKFAKDSGLEALMVVPNLVKHIGFVSSLGKGWKNPREFRM